MIVSKNRRHGTLCMAIGLCAVVQIWAPVAAQDEADPNVVPVRPVEAIDPQNMAPKQASEPLAPVRTLTPSHLATGSAAQLTPASRLVPGHSNPPLSLQNKNDPSGGTARGGPTPLPPSSGLLPIGINVEELQQIDPDSLGTLTIEEGGFGTLMWDGSPRRKIERLLPKLPTRSTSRAMRDLMRRLLLSTAKAPAGAPLVPSQKDLIGIRLGLLSAMGDLAGVSNLIKEVPSTAYTDRLLRSELDALFMRNDNAGVCSLVASQIGQVETPYWQKAFIFCQSLAGEHDKAALGVSLLRETGDNDKIFNGLLEQLSGLGAYKVVSLVDPKPLHFAMVRAAKTDLPSDVTASNNPAILRTIATSPNARPELRLDAAERAESMGALKTEVLRQLYAGVTFSEKALENPLTTADSQRNPLSRALLYRKALVENIPTASAEVLSRALKLGRDGGQLPSLARVYLPILQTINPTQDFVWFSTDAIRAFLAAGDLQSASQWFDMLKNAAVLDENAARTLSKIQPLARLAGAINDTEWNAGLLAKWWQASNAENEENPVVPEVIRTRAALLYNLLDSFGDAVGDADWGPLLDGPPQSTVLMPQPALWRSLDIAVQNLRVGETILVSLLALGESGPAQANPTVLHKVIKSLRTIGLEEEARALAVEAAVAAGL